MDQIDQTISGYVKNNEISGGALLVRKAGEVVYQNKWGYADVAAGAPVEYDSIYRMMSMTKPVTAVGILKLMDRGLITLDDPLSKFLLPPVQIGHRLPPRRFPLPGGNRQRYDL